MVTVEDEGVIIINDTNGVDCTSASPYYVHLIIANETSDGTLLSSDDWAGGR